MPTPSWCRARTPGSAMPAPPLNSLETSNRLQITSEGYRLYVNAVIDMFAIEVAVKKSVL
jgi:hypothetical protein